MKQLRRIITFMDIFLNRNTMKIAVFGAGGRIGSRIVDEALNRGHDVTAVVRHPENYTKIHTHLKVAKGDLFNSQDVETGAFDQDAVVSAYSPAAGIPPSTITELAVPLINGLKQAHVKRLIIVGGAGSLEVAPGLQLVDTPDFPAVIEPGERTGKFRTGTNQLLSDANGKSFITMEDYAVAVIDEIESPLHIREIMTAGY